MSQKDQASFWTVHSYVRKTLGLSECYYTDLIIIKFFLGHFRDPATVIKAITKSVDWRKDFPFEQVAAMDTTPFIEFQKMFNMGFYGLDKSGRPIRIIKVPDIDPSKMMELFTEEQFMLQTVVYAERMLKIIFEQCSRKAGYPIFNCVLIVDIQKLHISKIIFNSKFKKFLSAHSKVFQENYPELACRIFIINAGKVGALFFGFLKLFLNKYSVKKISVHNKDYMKEIAAFVDPKELPQVIGGGCKVPIYQYKNFWDEEIDASIREKRLS